MNLWTKGRLVDMFSYIDIGLLEGDLPEADLEKDLVNIPERKAFGIKRKMTIATGIAVGSAALTGAVLSLCRRNAAAKQVV